ncbi:hypothetical protein [Roseibium sp. RKSG952]|uniref:hypothetical protein n=1 Tax=Roseibium sp. RKSG952 TaxID=2529384 RepID=UPI001AD8C97B|nr:hypothetical protein [Roseibium sp. RKSG952]
MSRIFDLAQIGIVPSCAVVPREVLLAHGAGWRIGLVVMSTVADMTLDGWLPGRIHDVSGPY